MHWRIRRGAGGGGVDKKKSGGGHIPCAGE